MVEFTYQDANFDIRSEIKDAHRVFWQKLSKPGSWWTGEQRIAIAEQSRQALKCAFCEARRNALSPYTFEGKHDYDSVLPYVAVDAVHRIITDQTRITRKYVDDNVNNGLSKEAYVELVGIVVAMFSMGLRFICNTPSHSHETSMLHRPVESTPQSRRSPDVIKPTGE